MSERQAVVIIHGIGEQKPMDTLRAFVTGVRDYLAQTDTSETKTTIRSKPDGVSESYETRRLTLSASRNRPRTDFYEFYWAHNMRNTIFSQTIPWLWRLITTSPRKIPERLRKIWYTVWVLVLLIVATVFLIYGIKEWKAFAGLILALPFVLTLVGILQKWVSNAFLSTAGDAARYFTPTPGNINERDKIRKQGLDFLEKLHEKKYERIILVGHSLGSVIGYDLLRLLWTKYHTSYAKNLRVKQDHLEQINKFSHQPEHLSGMTDAFQEAQFRCWLELKAAGNVWRISDFVSLGAAVCCSDYFLGTTAPFSELIQQLEYPVCPPVTDREIFFMQHYQVEGQPRSIKVLHHAALFAVTRWTNIFFTSDFVGSRGDRVFGKGIKDVVIPRRSLWFLPGGHTGYWNSKSKKSLEAIAEALKLRPDNNPTLEDIPTKSQEPG
jgi:hypothetical protein